MKTNFSADELKYLNSADVWVYQGTAEELKSGSLPYENGARNNDVFLIDIASDAGNTTPGFIYDGEQEKGGVDLDGTGTGYKVTSENTLAPVGSVAKSAKTNANTFTAPEDGIYSVVFFSKSLTAENPTMMKLSDTTTPFEKTQKGSTIASWDISVFNNGTKQSGRVFTKTLFLNMGGNALNSQKVSKGSLYSNVYAVTDDGYQYKVDFNGMDPYGFVFFANNRGLLNVTNDGTTETTSSLYHGVRSDNNLLSDFTKNNIELNAVPYDSTLDKTYNLFYEKPSAEALAALNIDDPTAGQGGISNFKFKGKVDTKDNEGYVGKGGTFSFDASSDISATSYEIQLNFGTGNTVTLSNTLKKGALNTIAWNGKDANGNVVPAGTYDTSNIKIKLKGGEVHFPLLDVEQNVNGIKITRLNGTDPDSMVYYNNSNTNAGSVTGDWTIAKNWTAGSETDAAVDGVDSSVTGAVAFTNTNTINDAKKLRNPNGSVLQVIGDGDQCALDVWAYYDRTVTPATYSFTLKDTSFTVTKAWVNTAGTPAAGNPKNVTMTLQESTDGVTWANVTKDVTGTAVINPATYDSSVSSTYTWKHLDPSKSYQVVEKAMTGYITTYGNVTKSTDTEGNVNAAQTVTNTYHPTTLKLTKIWNMNGTTTPHPDSVTLNVYTDAKKTNPYGGDIILNASNHWTYTMDPVDPTLTYYVYENNVPAGYSVNGTGLAAGNGNKGFVSTITNSFSTGDYMSVGVFKYWIDAEDENRPAAILVTLYKDNEKVTQDALGNTITNPITLNDDNGWYYVWSALVKKDTSADGYVIKETDTSGNALGGYTTNDTKLNFLHNFGFGGFENTIKKTSFTVSKVWQNNGNPITSNAVTVRLKQSVDNGKTYSDISSLSAVSLSDANNWTQTWYDLPSYTADNQQILYKAAEEAVTDYTVSGDPSFDGNTFKWSQTLTNTSVYTALHVEKKWVHGTQNEADWPASAVVTLYADGIEYRSGTLSDENSWAGTFYDLPIYDEKTGKKIVYTVDELDVDGYTKTGGTITGDTIGGYQVVITNTHIEPKPEPSNPPDSNIPNTGDATNAAVWAVVLFGSIAAIIALFIFKKKKS